MNFNFKIALKYLGFIYNHKATNIMNKSINQQIVYHFNSRQKKAKHVINVAIYLILR